MSIEPQLQPTAAAPAQVTFTSNVFASPEFIGALATIITLVAGQLGVHVLADPAQQQLLVMFLGMGMTALGHYLFPGASGKLSLTAPAPWSTPAAQDLPAGTSVVAVPAAKDAQQVAAVVPLDVGTHTVQVADPPPVLPPVVPVLPPNVTVTKA